MADSPNIVLSSPSGTGNAQLYLGITRLVGINVRETVGTSAAAVIIHDGTTTADPVVWEFSLTAGGGAKGSDNVWMGPDGIRIKTGIFIERSGAGSTRVQAAVH